MNIVETLKNVDFEKQAVKLTFKDGSTFETSNCFSSRDERIYTPKLTLNEDDTITIVAEDNRICCFRTECLIKIDIKTIHYTEDITGIKDYNYS